MRKQSIISVSLYPSQVKKIDNYAKTLTEVDRGNLRSFAIRQIIDQFNFGKNKSIIRKETKNVK